LKDQSSRTRFFAAEALGRIAYEPAINPVIEMLQANNDADAYLRHAGSLALARIGKADPVLALSGSPSRALRIAAVVALRRMQHPGIASFLKDQDEFIVTETARAINDDLSIKDALPALGDVLATTKFKNEALIRRAINANLRVGTDKAMQNLIDYAGKEGNPVAMRSEAVDALSTWAKPSVLDRVDGRYRGEITRDAEQVRSKSAEAIIALANHREAPVRLSSVKATGKLKITQASAPLFTLLKNDKDPQVRVEALRALAVLEDKQIGQAIEQALSDKEKTVRVAGLDLLGKMDISKDLMVSLLKDVINTKTTEEKQAALVTLSKLPVAQTQPVLEDMLTKLEAGKVPAEIQLELSEAIDSSKSQPLINRYKEITSKASPDAVMASYQGSLLGGDAKRGERIFYSHPTAQCLRCHSYDDMGGNAGPRLNGVAKRLARPQILEAVINPSARLAPGFGLVMLELKGGKNVSGILQQEKPNSLVVKVGNQPDTTISTAHITKRTNAPSSMPDMKQLLTKREIRDLVSFLSTLKAD
jgi:putative heme-binding domain-containing protein